MRYSGMNIFYRFSCSGYCSGHTLKPPSATGRLKLAYSFATTWSLVSRVVTSVLYVAATTFNDCMAISRREDVYRDGNCHKK